MTSKKKSQIRIIAGSFRGRKIEVIDRVGLRPTSNRVRETLFNWLQPYIVGSRCLDLFAGSGALGFESLSRGASDVWLLDSDPEAIKAIKKTSDMFSIDRDTLHAVNISYSNSKNILNNLKFDVVFLDPPFNRKLLSPACVFLQESDLLAADSMVYTESELGLSPLPVPQSWVLYRQMQTKQSNCCLWQVA